MSNKKLFLLLTAICLLAFKGDDAKVFDFAYPKRKDTGISISSAHIKKFKEEWHDTDYYYFGEGDGFICSVLYYKLNDSEQKSLVKETKILTGDPDRSPAYPFAYFGSSDKFKSMETNETIWGEPTDDFMFRQNDLTMTGIKITQKNMYAYAMVDKDMFVNIHLSKMAASPADSTELMAMLKSLVIKNKAITPSK